MSPQRLVCVLSALLAAACAAGEPIDTLDRDLVLGEDDPTLIDAELVVEVTDAGRSVIADAVWLADASGDPIPAYCMVHAGLDRCETWFVEAETEGPLTVHAEVCGRVYSQSIAFAIEPSTETITWSSHIGIEADATACGRTKPEPCEDAATDPAFEVTTVTPTGVPIEVTALTIERQGDPAAPADCLDPFARGCTSWSSQQRAPGLYRAIATHCGKQIRTPWQEVPTDDACQPIPQQATLQIDPHPCHSG